MLPATERAILAILMDRNELSQTVFDNLDRTYFNGASADVFTAIQELREDGMDFKWSTVKDKLGPKFSASFWPALMEATRGIHVSGYESFLKEKICTLKMEYGKRKLIAEINQVAGKSTLEENDVEALDQTVHSMRLIGRPKETACLADALGAYQEHIRQEASEITTGFPSFDRRIDGFNLGELVMIMARAGVGKTFFALNVINHLAGKTPFKIGLFSLEMPKAAIVERMLEVYFGLSRHEVKAKALDGSLYLPDFEARFSKLSIYDKIYSVSEIRKIVEREGYRIVVVDFLHLVRPEVIGSPYQQISQIVADLKRMAKDTDCVAFLLHQLSRQAGSGWTAVEAAHARDSGQIEELSDFLFGIWAPGLNPAAPADDEHVLRVRLIKNKRGERWTADCEFEKHSGKIGEIEKEHDDGLFRRKTQRGERGLYEHDSDDAPGD
jgi:replicative DNA helicase